VHRVRAHNDDVRARRGDGRRGGGEDLAGFVPLAGVLQFFDVVEVDAVQQ
jgi:hypothetical protein